MSPTVQKAVLGWRLTKEISIGNLLTMGSLIVALITWGTKIENRIAVLEERSIVALATDGRHEAEAERTRQDLAKRFDRMEEKLDRLIQKSTR